jgi:large subunit ribosomal protein L15
MQAKRRKRSRIRAAKVTAGHGHKKKNRGAGNRGGRGKAGTGKRGTANFMKVTGGDKNYLGKHGFTSIQKSLNAINTNEIQKSLLSLVQKGKAELKKDIYELDLTKLGYDKLLSKGPVNVKLNIKVKSATQNAINKVVKAGGLVETEKQND